MATVLQEDHQDALEYVQTIKQLGGDEKMAKYQVRYHEQYVHQTIKEYIADLKLERFATKDDIIELRHEISSLRQETNAKIESLRQETKADIALLRSETKAEMKAMEHRLLIWQISIAIAVMSANFATIKFFVGH